MTNTACLNWPARLQDGRLPMSLASLPTRTKKAKRISRVFQQLQIPDIIGQPEVGTLPNFEWVDQSLKATFGGDVIRETFVLAPKKQGKSALFGLGFLAAFLVNQRPGASFTILAPSVGVAGLVFDIIVGAARADETLDAICHVKNHMKTIEHRQTGATLAIKAFSAEAIVGLRGSVLVDEVHILGAASAGSKLRAQIKGALTVSGDTRVIYTSTAADHPPRGVFADLLGYARSVRDGRLDDPTFLPVIWEPWEGCPDPFEDESVWPSLLPSYPNLGDAQFYRSVVAEARQGGASAIAVAKSQFFNCEVGIGLGSSAWLLAERWMDLALESLSVEQVIARSERVAFGIDLGGSEDLTALAVIGVDQTGNWLISARGWLTPAAYAHNVQERSAIDDAIDDGDLFRILPGAEIPPMIELINRARDLDKLHCVGVDPALAEDLADALEAAGYSLEGDDAEIMGIGQSAFRLAPAHETLDRRAAEGRIIGDNSRLMRWSLGNAVIEDRGRAKMIERPNTFAKIDICDALLDAASAHVLRRSVAVDASTFVF